MCYRRMLRRLTDSRADGPVNRGLTSGTHAADPGDSRNGGRIRELDGLRGIAIGLVVVWHYFVSHAQAAPGSFAYLATRALSLSWAGVDLFFVLSGFLIGGILIDSRGQPGYFSRFYVCRVARLMPLYLLVLGLFAFALPMAGTIDPDKHTFLFYRASDIPLWTYLTYTQNLFMAGQSTFGPEWLGPTWSLAVEEQFYLVAPLIIFLTPVKRLPALLATLTFGAFAARMTYLAAGGSIIGSYVLLPTRGEGLMIGILIACLYRRPAARTWLKAHQGVLMAMLACLLCGLALFIAAHQGMHAPYMRTFGYSYLPLVAAAVLLVALEVDRPAVKAVFVNPVLVQLGTISYGVYLLNLPVYDLVTLALTGIVPQAGEPSRLTVAVISLALTVIIARLSWHHFERPLIALAHRRTSPPQGALRPLAAPS